MSNFKFSYGDSFIELEIPDRNIIGIIDNNKEGLKNSGIAPRTMVENALCHPEGAPRLRQILRKNRPGHLTIIVSDISRNIGSYGDILAVLVGEIIESGVREENIEFIIGLGTHRPHTDEENKNLYGPLVEKFKFSFHNCEYNLKKIGKTDTGLEILINSSVVDADFVITTGKISFHYLAGFSGGRKSILPGVAGYETIRCNHAKLLRDGISIGQMKNNVINHEMNEAARLVDVDYSLNVIENHDRELIWGKAGCPETVFGLGTEFLKNNFSFPINKKADCIFVAAGKESRDFFQAHKIINFACDFVKPGGSIILYAQTGKGLGNEKFSNYLTNQPLATLVSYPEDKIEVGGHRAFVTARLLKQFKIYVHSSIDDEILSRMSFRPFVDLRNVITELRKTYGEAFTAYVNPQGHKYRARLKADKN